MDSNDKKIDIVFSCEHSSTAICRIGIVITVIVLVLISCFKKENAGLIIGIGFFISIFFWAILYNFIGQLLIIKYRKQLKTNPEMQKEFYDSGENIIGKGYLKRAYRNIY